MLSPTAADIVRATLPTVQNALGEVSTRFYARLFTAHPDLLRHTFNRGNQANGSQQQALAGAFASFAGMLLSNPDQRPDALLGRIAHKHASLGISPGQYTVVHEHLMAAVGEVLGDPFTPEVAAAWDEVYWLMANSLISLERTLYAQHGVLVGDTWRGWTVVARTHETDEVTTFALSPADGRPAPRFRAGQYVSVQVELADGARQIRQYSLSRAVRDTDTRHITVKRTRTGDGPDGEVSNHLSDHIHEGDTLQVSAPYGDLVIADTDAPLLLASAGIGCTPMVAMLEDLALEDHRGTVIVVHGDRAAADHAHRGLQKRLADQLSDGRAHFWYEKPNEAEPGDLTGLVDLSGLTFPEGLHAYLCGPLPFMRQIKAQLTARGVDPSHVHYEVFGPDLWLGGEENAGALGPSPEQEERPHGGELPGNATGQRAGRV